jgi:hypothetical protein
MPKKMPFPPYQERVKSVIDSDPERTWTTSDLALQTRLEYKQVAGALTHLVKKGEVVQPEAGVSEYRSLTALAVAAKTSPDTNRKYTPGSLFECAGYTEAGTLVLRSLDTQLLVPVKLHTAVS